VSGLPIGTPEDATRPDHSCDRAQVLALGFDDGAAGFEAGAQPSRMPMQSQVAREPCKLEVECVRTGRVERLSRKPCGEGRGALCVQQAFPLARGDECLGIRPDAEIGLDRSARARLGSLAKASALMGDRVLNLRVHICRRPADVDRDHVAVPAPGKDLGPE
jgi:hypothetical protein